MQPGTLVWVEGWLGEVVTTSPSGLVTIRTFCDDAVASYAPDAVEVASEVVRAHFPEYFPEFA